MSILRCPTGLSQEERGVECGCDDAFLPRENARWLVDLHCRARVAANEVLDVPSGDVITLEIVER